MWDLVSWPGTEPDPPVLGAWSLNHWTTREIPGDELFVRYLHFIIFFYRELKRMLKIPNATPLDVSTHVPPPHPWIIITGWHRGQAGEGNGNLLHSILAWRIPWIEEPQGLQSLGSQRIGHDRSNWACRGVRKAAGHTHTLIPAHSFIHPSCIEWLCPGQSSRSWAYSNEYTRTNLTLGELIFQGHMGKMDKKQTRSPLGCQNSEGG